MQVCIGAHGILEQGGVHREWIGTRVTIRP